MHDAKMMDQVAWQWHENDPPFSCHAIRSVIFKSCLFRVVHFQRSLGGNDLWVSSYLHKTQALSDLRLAFCEGMSSPIDRCLQGSVENARPEKAKCQSIGHLHLATFNVVCINTGQHKTGPLSTESKV